MVRTYQSPGHVGCYEIVETLILYYQMVSAQEHEKEETREKEIKSRKPKQPPAANYLRETKWKGEAGLMEQRTLKYRPPHPPFSLFISFFFTPPLSASCV